MRPWLVGEEVVGAQSRWPRLVWGLVGTTVQRIEPVGKHLLIGFSDRSHLRVHLRMTGTWHRYDPGEAWQRSRGDLAVSLATREHVLVCFKAPDVERIDDRALPTHPKLSALGPDLMHEEVDLDEVMRRAQGHARLADLLLDQHVACGLGNVYKSELAFLTGVHPLADPATIDPKTLRELYRRGSELLRANVGRERNTTGRRRPLLWVYGRAGRPCLRCGERVRRHQRDAADRVTYWCPGCQNR